MILTKIISARKINKMTTDTKKGIHKAKRINLNK